MGEIIMRYTLLQNTKIQKYRDTKIPKDRTTKTERLGTWVRSAVAWAE